MKTRHLLPLGGALLALVFAGCGGLDQTTGDPSIETIESHLESPADYYTMDDELAPDALRAEFGALDPDTVTTLDNELGDIDLFENDDTLAETSTAADAAGNPKNAPTDPNTADPNTAGGKPSTDPNAAGTHPVRPNPCLHGYLKGHWKHIKKGFGVFKGAFVNQRGDLVGWVRGVFGNGKFVGKVHRKGGKTLAVLVGVYHAGQFRGRLINRDGVFGAARGVYGNHVFKGKWTVFCQPPPILCKPGMVPHPSGLFCVPRACKPGSCPANAYCDMCPTVCRDLPAPGLSTKPIACGTAAALVCPKGLRCDRPNSSDPSVTGRCVPDTVCIAVCGQPVCRPRPLPAPKPAPCAATSLGGLTSCKPLALWRKYADGLCTAKKRVLSALSAGDVCGKDLFRRVKFACCERPNTTDPAGTPSNTDPASGAKSTPKSGN